MSKPTQASNTGRDENEATNKTNEGPDRVSKTLDDTQQWDDVAEDKGFQKGDQGGYKGSYDETKFEQIQDKDLVENSPRGDESIKKGDDDGKKRPMKQDDRTADKREP